MAPTASLIKICGLCGIVSALLFTAADVTGAILRPGYSSIAQAVSELIEAGAPNKMVLDAMLFGFHGLVIPFSYGLHWGLSSGKGSKLGPILLGAAGVIGVVLTALFPCDPGCNPETFRGTMHIAMAIPMGFLIIFAILAFSRRLIKQPGWTGYGKYSLATFIVAVALAITTVVLAKSPIGGLLERVLTASYQQWYVVMGIVLLRR